MVAGGTVRILVVEPEGAPRERLLQALADEHFDAVAEADGQHALELLRAGLSPHLIIVDLETQKVAGVPFEVALRRDESFAHVPVLMLTGPLDAAPDPLRVDALLPKPFELTTLMERVKQFLPREGIRRVLVVEDDADVRDAVLEFLELSGVEARGAENGRQALSTLESGFMPGLVITDWSMPGMDGAALIRALHASPAWSGLPVMVASAVGTPGLQELELRSTREQRPFRHLLEEVRALIGGARTAPTA